MKGLNMQTLKLLQRGDRTKPTIYKLGANEIEPPWDCRILNAPREYDNENTELYP